jgi:hypothetical protein
MELDVLKALSLQEPGVQITLEPDLAIIDLGYGSRKRFVGKTLLDVCVDTAEDVLKVNWPEKVAFALRRIEKLSVFIGRGGY